MSIVLSKIVCGTDAYYTKLMSSSGERFMILCASVVASLERCTVLGTCS